LPTTDFEGDPRIVDGDGDSVAVVDMGADEFVLLNLPPVADAGGPYIGDEGSAITFDGSASSDPDGDPLQYRWDFENDGTWDTVWSSVSTASYTWGDDHTGTVKLEVSDGTLTDSDTASVTVNNVAPVLGAISASLDPVEVGTPVTASASFTDVGTLDTHTALWDWGDGTTPGTVTEAGGSGSVTDNHTYTVPGVYTITLTVTDDDGGVDQSVFEYVVIYDPDAGFVTGGGWIDSPEGAYVPEPSLTGKATFGFVSRYKKGANVPMGHTQFRFRAGDLHFQSSSYDWLVVTQAGTNAQFKGTGTINGAGDYRFMLWAGDDDPDTFRIRIWEEDGTGTETVRYDNGFDQQIGGGSIVIHAK
jgi:PKD repeat protein